MSLGERWRRIPQGWKWALWGMGAVLTLSAFALVYGLHCGFQKMGQMDRQVQDLGPVEAVLDSQRTSTGTLVLPLHIPIPRSSLSGMPYVCINELLPPGRTLEIPADSGLPLFWHRQPQTPCVALLSDGNRSFLGAGMLEPLLDKARRYIQENSKPVPPAP